MRLVSLAAAVVLSSCTFATVVPEANSEFKPSGEVLLYNRSVSFDAVRIRSPLANMTKRTDGSWGGTVNNAPLDITVNENRVSGVNFSMTRENSEGNKVIYTGQFQGRIYRFELDEQQAMIRAPAKSMTLPGRQVGNNQTTYGPMGNLQLRGEAGSDNPPWPQLALSLMVLMQ